MVPPQSFREGRARHVVEGYFTDQNVDAVERQAREDGVASVRGSRDIVARSCEHPRGDGTQISIARNEQDDRSSRIPRQGGSYRDLVHAAAFSTFHHRMT